jgi:hypothetical protein
MTRTMYDGVTATRLPVSAAVVGGYVDGQYAWSAADWARFPRSVKVRIAVFPSTNDGHVLDVEPGDATPAQSVDWVLMRRRAGVDPTVYMNTSTWQTVRSAFAVRGVAEPHYWVAAYDDNAVIPAGAIGKQYYNNDTLGYDLSVVADYWPGVDPRPTPSPAALRENEMILHSITGSPEVWALSGSLYWHVADPQSLNSYKAAGVPQATITPAEHAAILAATKVLSASAIAAAVAASLSGASAGTGAAGSGVIGPQAGASVGS